MSDTQVRLSRWFDEQGQPRFDTSPQAPKAGKSKEDKPRYGLADLGKLHDEGMFVQEDEKS